MEQPFPSAPVRTIILDEFGGVETSFSEARTLAKKTLIVVMYLVLVADIAVLVRTFRQGEWDGFTIFQVVLELLVVTLLLPKALGWKKGFKVMELQGNLLLLKSGLYYRKTVDLSTLCAVSTAKAGNGNHLLVLETPDGKTERTRVQFSFMIPEDKERILAFVEEVNQRIGALAR